MRAAFFRLIRTYFYEQDFLEVDTPVRLPLLIPESMIEPVTSAGWFLQTSPELCMKRLLARGNKKIFQICSCFRKNERGRLHSEEFKMLEWYRQDADYMRLMDDCVALARFLTVELPKVKNSLLTEKYLQRDWQKLTVQDAFERFCSTPFEEALAGDDFDKLLVEQVEPRLGFEQPTFLYNYPVEQASLAKLCESDRTVAERFELYMYGVEIANGFSELTDSHELRDRFEAELINIRQGGNWQSRLPEKFLDDLDLLGRAAGIALGLDRLFMLFLGENSLSGAVSFAERDLDL